MPPEETPTQHTWTKEPGRTWSVFEGRVRGPAGVRTIQVWCATTGVEAGWADVSYFEVDGFTPVEIPTGTTLPAPGTFLFSHRAGD